MLKRCIPLMLALMMLFSVSAMAARDVTVMLDGEKLEFDVPPQIINDRTMVPMRKIFETLGAEVTWIAEERGIIATRGSTIIIMQIDSPILVKADVATQEETRIELDSPPVIVQDRTLVPLRAISESLGLTVSWDAETYTVIMTSGAAQTGDAANEAAE